MRRYLLLIALVAAGCGGATASKNDYVESLNKASAVLREQLPGLGTSLGSGGPEAAAQLEEGADALDAAAKDVGKIDPPDDAAKAHRKMVVGLEKLAGTFHDAAAAAKSKDVDELQKTLARFQDDSGVKEIQEAESELKANGYAFTAS